MAALHSRSSQVAAAARIVFVNWLAGLQLWLILEGASLTFGYIVVDAVTAVLFFRMSRERWFPAPLCFMHGVLVIYHFGTLFNTGGLFWEKFILNRAFDVELLYITACALFRIAIINRGGAWRA
ncbi:hypothetical protein [Hyphococcus sp.]|uniref:hypothetical protein n=1 Tax=Hyphococcus sp. TaxID=2038636 RepID=UPI003D0DF74C